jgi:UDP-glucose 4-epimerase
VSTAGAEDFRAFYRDRRVMITGGLGFIGSNLARQLAALGARVLLIDSLSPSTGEISSTSAASRTA